MWPGPFCAGPGDEAIFFLFPFQSVTNQPCWQLHVSVYIAADNTSWFSQPQGGRACVKLTSSTTTRSNQNMWSGMLTDTWHTHRSAQLMCTQKSAGFSQDLFNVHYHFLVFHRGKLLCVCSVSCAVVAIYLVGLHNAGYSHALWCLPPVILEKPNKYWDALEQLV